MESTPHGLSLQAVRERILSVPGVVGVHDLHAWQITAGLPMITAHVVGADGEDFHRILHEVDSCLSEDFDLTTARSRWSMSRARSSRTRTRRRGA